MDIKDGLLSTSHGYELHLYSAYNKALSRHNPEFVSCLFSFLLLVYFYFLSDQSLLE
jgi:hypothetical protein